MIIFHYIKDLQDFIRRHAKNRPVSGFVPTMGALHPGHISLVKACRSQTDLTFASIFVNPTQFNDPQDFERYPITIEKDILMLEEAGCDVLFLPEVSEIYPNGTNSGELYELGTLESILEGVFRPGHFQGVCRVVHRLLDIVKPAHLFMGQKDFQQCMVIQQLIKLKGLAVTLHTCPTLREPDGLAMSSRNMLLNDEERKVASAIFRELMDVQQKMGGYGLRMLEQKARQNLLKAGFSSVDYVSIAETSTLTSLQEWNRAQPAVILAAAFLGKVRLIDNILVPK